MLGVERPQLSGRATSEVLAADPEEDRRLRELYEAEATVYSARVAPSRRMDRTKQRRQRPWGGRSYPAR
jgi:hypothetical protein